MISKRYLIALAGVAVMVSHVAATHPPGDSGCVTCHTDAETIRSLYTPPKLDFTFDEGEG